VVNPIECVSEWRGETFDAEIVIESATLMNEFVARSASRPSPLRAAHPPEGRPGCHAMAVPDEQQGGALHAAISDAVVRITAEYTGRGPTRARTTISGDWIFVTLSDTLTKGERKLAATGRSQFVRETRKAFQDAMRDEFVAAIENITGRAVTAFLSDNHMDPDVAIECFQLASRDGGA
jgi:uncharacterized protein YbcI